MNIYERKRRWKWILFAIAVLIVTISLWYTNILVQKIASEERVKLKMWADAIQRKARFVAYTENFFLRLKAEEQKRVHQLAMATQKLATASGNTDITFFSEIIQDNTTIPVILTDENDLIISARNIDFKVDTVKHLHGRLKKEFTRYPPLIIEFFPGNKNYFYYTDSRLFSELRLVLDDLIQTFFSEVVENSASVPVIITDSTWKKVLAYGNMDSLQMRDTNFVRKTLTSMAAENTPIALNLEGIGSNIIFYKSSYLLTQLKFYPLFQLGVIALFLFIAYMLFSTARRSEQNQVWVGMAKETAHQLGTPISSIMAWVELMKMNDENNDMVGELEKDTKRLGTIADRFSKIGSSPSLKEDNVVRVIRETVDYLKPRTSKKVSFTINTPHDEAIIVPLNPGLFEWVIENLCKNSTDAMVGNGSITIDIMEEKKLVIIDVTDTGKGIPRSQFKTIFHPGYTSKKRGWGLGLTLSRRIIKEYHKGKIFVKNSVVDQGTTIRIILNK
ncbi:MAG: HAMP domain-containing sensor histidine kinase [Bacteroidetes bacterium]|nr:HAMP domain-containing sensor histidine kinase [Bacteroidota bacterium]